MKIHYDGFDKQWDEWIPFNKQFRTAPHKTKSLGQGKTEGGVHVLVATRFGRSSKGYDLRKAMDPTSQIYLTDVKCLMSGFLYKRGNWNKDWKKRWFVLRNDMNLYYYEKKDLKFNEYRGIIALSNVRKIIRAVTSGRTQHSFDIQTSSRRYNFSCQTDQDLKDWMGVLQCLMSNKLEDIAPRKEHVMPLQFDMESPRRSPTERFHRESWGDKFHKLTVTTPPTVEKATSQPTRSGRGNSVIDIFRGVGAKIGKRDSGKQRSSHTSTRSSMF